MGKGISGEKFANNLVKGMTPEGKALTQKANRTIKADIPAGKSVVMPKMGKSGKSGIFNK